MILKTNTHSIDIKAFTKNGGLTLYVPLDTNLGELRAAVQEADEISFYSIDIDKEEQLVTSITGAFAYDSTYVDAEHIKVVFKKSDSDIAKIGEAITNIELALCEIYENMGV